MLRTLFMKVWIAKNEISWFSQPTLAPWNLEARLLRLHHLRSTLNTNRLMRKEDLKAKENRSESRNLNLNLWIVKTTYQLRLIVIFKGNGHRSNDLVISVNATRVWTREWCKRKIPRVSRQTSLPKIWPILLTSPSVNSRSMRRKTCRLSANQNRS